MCQQIRREYYLLTNQKRRLCVNKSEEKIMCQQIIREKYVSTNRVHGFDSSISVARVKFRCIAIKTFFLLLSLGDFVCDVRVKFVVHFHKRT